MNDARNAETLLPPPPSSTIRCAPRRPLGKCEGYEWPCQQPATWTVEGTTVRDEWQACDHCSLDALIYNGATCEDETGYRLVIPR